MLVMAGKLVAESVPLSRSAFCEGRGVGVRVYDGQITFLENNLKIADPHPYPSPLAKSAPGEGTFSVAIFHLITQVIILMLFNLPVHAEKPCHPLLWPENAFHQPSKEVIADVKHAAKTALNQPAHPVPTLSSAGQSSLHDEKLLATREGFKDADHAAILALAYALTHEEKYLHKTRDILLAWSAINKPTGHPIDETRLEGMIWAYDLIACDLTQENNQQIKHWFEDMRVKKNEWEFGEKTSKNNHRIHQLKMLLLLDKVLNHPLDISNIEKYSRMNIHTETGETVDYQERTALYYHNYVLQPWLSISLISGCCKPSVDAAFDFLSNKILKNDINGEFVQSTAKLDKVRGINGFAYAKKDSTFDVSKAAPTILLYYTLHHETPNETLWQIQQQAKPSPWLTFLRVRRELWNPPLVNHLKHSI
jgi:hypothetical protein